MPGSFSDVSGLGDGVINSTNKNLILGAKNGTGNVLFTTGQPDTLKMVLTNAGNLGVGTASPRAGLDVATLGTGSSAIIVPRDSVANRPSQPVNGMIRYASDTSRLETFQNGTWQNVTGGTASSTPMSGLTAATAVNTIDGLNFAQNWNWSTATTQTPLNIAANNLTTGSGLSLTSSSPALTSTAGLLNVANTGTSTSGLLARLQANGSAASGLTVLTNGNVGIGSATPAYALDVAGVFRNGGTAYLTTGNYGSTAPTVVIGDNLYGFSSYNGGLFSYANSGFYFTKGGTITMALGDGLSLGAGFTGIGAPTNGAIIQGAVGIGTSVPLAGLDVKTVGTASAIIVPRDSIANRPTAPVNGMIRYASDTGRLEAYQAGAWGNVSGGAASNLPLSGLTAATAVNTIDSLNFAQNWNWSTATTQAPLSLSANGLTTGTTLSITSSSNALNSTNGLLNVANTGTSTNGLVARIVANTTAGSGLSVGANGNVGVGTSAPQQTLQVNAPSFPKLQVGPSTAINDGAQLILSATDGSAVATSSFVTAYGNGNLQFTAGTGGYVQSNSRLGVYTSVAPLSVMDVNGNVSVGAYAGVAAPTNGLIVSGLVGVGTSVPLAALDVTATGTAASAIVVPRDTIGNRPSVPVNGMIRYASDTGKLEAYQAGSWGSVSGGAASNLPLSGLTPATAVNTIDNLNFAQNWNWSTATTQNTLNFAANALTTGSLLSLSSSSTGLNSTAGLLNVANTGTSTSGLVARFQSNATAGSGLSVLANGNVGIGSLTPSYALDVNGGGRFSSGLYGTSAYFNNVRASFGTAANPTFTFVLDGFAGMYEDGANGLGLSTTGTARLSILGGGSVGIGTTAPQAALDVFNTGTTASAIIVPRDSTANRPSVPVNGMIRYASDTGRLEAYQSGAWGNVSGGTASSLPLSGITAATAVNTIDNVNFGQIWNWSTATTQTPLTLGANALTTGTALAVATSSPALNSSNGLLSVANTGTSTAGLVMRVQANGAAGSGLTALANGNVGIGTSAPSQLLDLKSTSPFINFIPNTNQMSGLTFQNAGVARYSFQFNSTLNSMILSRANGAGVYQNDPFIADALGNVSLGGTQALSSASGAALYASASGLVGVGTNNPLGGLDVSTTGTIASAIIVPRDTTANRPFTPVNGMLRYNNSLNAMEGYVNGGWSALATGASGASQWITSAANIYYSAGSVGIGTSSPTAALDVATTGTMASAIVVPRDTTGNRPSVPVNGMIRYASDTGKVEAYQAGAWSSLSGGTASNLPLSGITAAAATNAIDNLNFGQTWNWSTANTQTPLSLSANGLTTGSLLSLSSSSAALSSTNGLFNRRVHGDFDLGHHGAAPGERIQRIGSDRSDEWKYRHRDRRADRTRDDQWLQRGHRYERRNDRNAFLEHERSAINHFDHDRVRT